MKRSIKYILHIILLFFLHDVFAQSTDTNQKDSVVYFKKVNTDNVVNLRSFTDSVANQRSKMQNTQAQRSTTNSANSYDVGATIGNIDVSATGAANFSLNIATPPTVQNVVPNISIVYNSQGGNSVVGYGWSISGLSTITRIASTKHHDNSIGGVNFSPTDRFALDGQRLILKSGTYGADGAEYQTENFSNLRIFSRGSSSFGSNFGPDSFEVWYPDGSKSFYGVSADSKTKNEFGSVIPLIRLG